MLFPRAALGVGCDNMHSLPVWVDGEAEQCGWGGLCTTVIGDRWA